MEVELLRARIGRPRLFGPQEVAVMAEATSPTTGRPLWRGPGLPKTCWGPAVFAPPLLCRAPAASGRRRAGVGLRRAVRTQASSAQATRRCSPPTSIPRRPSAVPANDEACRPRRWRRPRDLPAGLSCARSRFAGAESGRDGGRQTHPDRHRGAMWTLPGSPPESSCARLASQLLDPHPVRPSTGAKFRARHGGQRRGLAPRHGRRCAMSGSNPL